MMATVLAVLLAVSAVAEEAPRTLRVLTYNVYGRQKRSCQERYKALGAEVLAASPAFDVVGLQEHWDVPYDPYFTCDANVLTQALEADGRYAGSGRSVRHKPAAASQTLEVAGGNSVFTVHAIIETKDGSASLRKIPLSGWALARVEFAKGAAIDVWDAHLEAQSDGCDRACRKSQLADLAAAIERYSGKKEGKGNPVVVMGDFNIGGPLAASAPSAALAASGTAARRTPAADKTPYPGNEGYEDIVAALRKPRDLWLELGSGDGHTYDCQNNKTQACKSRERIDFIFLLEDPAFLDPKSKYVLVPTAAGVARWTTPKGSDVSDHYGVEATLELRERAAQSKKAPLQRDFSRLEKAVVELGDNGIRWDAY